MEFNGTFFATILTFLLFVFMMNKILYIPILNIMEKRNDVIDENYKSVENNNSKIEELNADKEQKLSEAKGEAKIKYLEIVDEYKLKKNEYLKEIQAKASDKLNSSNVELQNLSNEAKEVLKTKMTDLANDITEKIIGYRSNALCFDNDKINEILYK